MSKPDCGAICYTNGKGCSLSTDGKCPHYFAQDEKAVKQSTKSYFNYKAPQKNGSSKTK